MRKFRKLSRGHHIMIVDSNALALNQYSDATHCHRRNELWMWRVLQCNSYFAFRLEHSAPYNTTVAKPARDIRSAWCASACERWGRRHVATRLLSSDFFQDALRHLVTRPTSPHVASETWSVSHGCLRMLWIVRLACRTLSGRDCVTTFGERYLIGQKLGG